MSKDTYKLVILGADWDLYKCAYNDIISDTTIYIPGFLPTEEPYKTLFKFHNTPKINSIIKLPFKSIWNYYYFRDLHPHENLIFVLFSPWLSIDPSIHLLDFIRKHFKNSKLILFLQDIVAAQGYLGVNIEEYFPKFDMVISYDRQDADKYNLGFHNTVFSKIKFENNSSEESDVFFIGQNKGRLPLLNELYNKLTSVGLKCKFILIDVPEEERLGIGNIEYIDKKVPYKDILSYVENTKCLLEILQPGAVGITYRTLEAIAYDKKLLTNNNSISDTGLYDPKNVIIFSSALDIDNDVAQNIRTQSTFENKYKEEISPKSLVKFIEQKLNIKIDID